MTGEVPLSGGTANHGQVFRVGDTVHRPLRGTSPATAALLEHLAGVGFDGAPRYLGVDELGREVVTYVEGIPVTPPYPPWALTDEALVSVAALLRRYHAAVESFDPTGLSWPEPAPAPFRTGLISHNDPNLDNIVFRGGTAVALIDFDLASPGSRLWDVAAAARLWAPLRTDDDIADARRGRGLARLRLLVDAYDLPPTDRLSLVDAVLANHDWLYDKIHGAVDAGHRAFGDYLAGGAEARAARTRQWYLASDALRTALL